MNKVELRVVETLTKYATETGYYPWQNPLVVRNLAKGGRGISGDYRGYNALITLVGIQRHGWDTREFRTFKQIADMGGHVKKGERGTEVLYPLWRYRDKDGNFLTDKEAKLLSEEEKKERGIERLFLGWKGYVVFNLAQTEGIDYAKEDAPTPSAVVEAETSCEEIIARWDGKPRIETVTATGGAGSYLPIVDLVQMYPKDSYKSQAGYYATLFHELIHSTGHTKRIGREINNSFGTPKYAKEELVAEIGSALLMSRTSLSADLKNSGAYIHNWAESLKKLNGFIGMLNKAISDAQEAVAWILENKPNKTAKAE